MSAPSPSDEAKIKEISRENRLSFRNRAEQLLRYEMKEEAKEICKPFIETFAECASEKGIWVVFSCKSQLKELNKCMAEHNGEEAWKKYREEHKNELAVRSKGQKYV